jgi:hypothetical protein
MNTRMHGGESAGNVCGSGMFPFVLERTNRGLDDSRAASVIGRLIRLALAQEKFGEAEMTRRVPVCSRRTNRGGDGIADRVVTALLKIGVNETLESRDTAPTACSPAKAFRFVRGERIGRAAIRGSSRNT